MHVKYSRMSADMLSFITFWNQKLKIGSRAERIVSAFHLVVSEHHGEDEEMNNCKSVVHRVKKLEKDIDLALTDGKLKVLFYDLTSSL